MYDSNYLGRYFTALTDRTVASRACMIIANQWAVTIYNKTFDQLNRDGLLDCLNSMTCTITCENILSESADAN